MAIAQLSGGPLDGQQLPLDDESQNELILPYTDGQLVYRRVGALENTGTADGPTEGTFVYVETSEPIDPAEDGVI